MKLTIEIDLDPGDQDIHEIRARLKGHASVLRDTIREGKNELGLENYILAKWSSDNNPRARRITWRVTQ